jgi:hypothetical protein
MKRELKAVIKSFGIELLVYGGLVTAYFFLVLRFMGGWLYRLYADERKTYAAVALLLVIGQGFLLEILTRALLQFIRRKEKK